MALGEYVRWTGDRNLAGDAAPEPRSCARAGSTSTATWTATATSSTCAARRAASATRAGRTLRTAVTHRDGRPAEPPVALAEVQGYVYAAWSEAAELFELFGEPERAAALRARAAGPPRAVPASAGGPAATSSTPWRSTREKTPVDHGLVERRPLPLDRHAGRRASFVGGRAPGPRGHALRLGHPLR